jgi:8-oxo-dGTP diphosphatase
MIICQWENKAPAKLRHVTVDCLVIKDSKILLIKRSDKTLTEPGKYALPGGYLDRDETPTEGAIRELLEETGYQAKKATFFRIIGNPNRPGDDRQSLDLVFTVEEVEKVGESDDEVTEITWFELTNLPDLNNIAFDHYESIQRYMEHKKQNFSLPILDI